MLISSQDGQVAPHQGPWSPFVDEATPFLCLDRWGHPNPMPCISIIAKPSSRKQDLWVFALPWLPPRPQDPLP